MNVIEGAGLPIEEPDWTTLIPARKGAKGVAESLRDTARREFLRVVRAMQDAETIAAENAHAVKRLILSYVRYDDAVARLMRDGAVVKSPRTKVPQHNLWQQEARAAHADATELEAELGLSPRRRNAAAKAVRRAKKTLAADKYLAAR